MSEFSRNLNANLINNLLKDNFFISTIKPDVLIGQVFPAIRNNRIDFYYKGGKLFSYDPHGFKTHRKYAGIIAQSKSEDYMYANDIIKYHHNIQLSNIYKGIKEYCQMYSELEALGVSHIYENFAFTNRNENIVVLDIEIAFEKLNSESDSNILSIEQQQESILDKGNIASRKGTDRIDILLLERKTGRLRFVEAKHFLNPEIRAKSDTPQVIKQLNRYNKQLCTMKGTIEAQYQNYCIQMCEIFEIHLPRVLELLSPTKLIVFGFDKEQSSNLHLMKLKNKLGNDFYPRGSVKSVKSSEMRQFFMD